LGSFKTLTVIGGGSAYTPGLLQALIHHQQSHISEVRLYDIHEKNLQTVERLGSRMSATAGSPFRVIATTSLAEALRDSDFILNSSRPGGLESRLIDETLPLEFGIPGQETVGPGGFFFALRSIPEALRVASLASSVASPGCIFLNYTNPSNIVTQALVEQNKIPVIGLCDQSDEDMAALGEALGLEKPPGFDCVGLNHATWYELHDTPIPRHPLTPPDKFDEEHKLRFRLSQKIAASTGLQNRWPNSYLAYYHFPEEFISLSRREGPRTQKILSKMAFYYSHFEEEGRKENPKLLHHRGSPGFGDMAVRVLAALQSNTENRIVLNRPAPEAQAFLFAAKTVIENQTAVGQKKIHALTAPTLPPASQSLLKRLEEYQLATARCALNGSFQALCEALTLNPLIPDSRVAEKMLQEARSRYGKKLEALQ